MNAKVRVGLLLLIMAMLAGLVYAFPVGRWLLELIGWVRGAGVAGVIIYFVFYVVGVTLFFPASLLTMCGGFIYGLLGGTLLVSPASVCGATIAFVIGRSFAREWVSRRIASNPRFVSIDEAIGARGFYIVFLLRLSPAFPFTWLNYALGLTRVKLRDYVLGSLLGMLPGTFLYVYLGSLITSAAQLLNGKRPPAGRWGEALFIAGLLATVGVTWLIARTAQRALSRAVQATESAPLNGRKEERLDEHEFSN